MKAMSTYHASGVTVGVSSAHAFEVWHLPGRWGDEEHRQIINHRSAAKARAEYWAEACEHLPGLKFTDVRCRKLGPPQTSEAHRATCSYRNRPDLVAGVCVVAEFTARERLAYVRQGLTGAYSGRFRNDWEPMFWFQRPGASGYFDKSSLSAASKNPGRCKVGYRTSSRLSTGEFYSRGASGDAVEQGLTRRGTIWDYGAVGKGCSGSPALEATGHPARFPLHLALDVVTCFSPPGGLVADPFLGSGTTLIATMRLGRRFAGGDKGHHPSGRPWIDIAAHIALEETRQQDLFTPHGEWQPGTAAPKEGQGG